MNSNNMDKVTDKLSVFSQQHFSVSNNPSRTAIKEITDSTLDQDKVEQTDKLVESATVGQTKNLNCESSPENPRQALTNYLDGAKSLDMFTSNQQTFKKEGKNTLGNFRPNQYASHLNPVPSDLKSNSQKSQESRFGSKFKKPKAGQTSHTNSTVSTQITKNTQKMSHKVQRQSQLLRSAQRRVVDQASGKVTQTGVTFLGNQNKPLSSTAHFRSVKQDPDSESCNTITSKFLTFQSQPGFQEKSSPFHPRQTNSVRANYKGNKLVHVKDNAFQIYQNALTLKQRRWQEIENLTTGRLDLPSEQTRGTSEVLLSGNISRPDLLKSGLNDSDLIDLAGIDPRRKRRLLSALDGKRRQQFVPQYKEKQKIQLDASARVTSFQGEPSPRFPQTSSHQEPSLQSLHENVQFNAAFDKYFHKNVKKHQKLQFQTSSEVRQKRNSDLKGRIFEILDKQDRELNKDCSAKELERQQKEEATKQSVKHYWFDKKELSVDSEQIAIDIEAGSKLKKKQEFCQRRIQLLTKAYTQVKKVPEKIINDTKNTRMKFQAMEQVRFLQSQGVGQIDIDGQSSTSAGGSNKVPKSRQRFLKREQEFEKTYLQVLDQWKQEQEQNESNSKQHLNQEQLDQLELAESMKQKKVDINLFKERDDDYKVIGNGLQLYATRKDIELRYINKNVKLCSESFDPLRIRLRVMPIRRAPTSTGKGADYYFVQAGKLGLRNEITKAIDTLKRGLMIKPDHLLCRFNHGVLMFKMGLIIEATEDFEQLAKDDGQKEPWVFYNYAICLIQHGLPYKRVGQNQSSNRNSFMSKRSTTTNARKSSPSLRRKQSESPSRLKFSQKTHIDNVLECDQEDASSPADFKKRSISKASMKTQNSNKSNQKQKVVVNQAAKENFLKAIQMCDEAIRLGQDDLEMLIDTYNLKAACFYRLEEPLNAVLMLKTARRIKTNMLNSRHIPEEQQTWENQFADFNVLEFGQEFATTDHQENLKKVHRSESFEQLSSRVRHTVNVEPLQRRRSQTKFDDVLDFGLHFEKAESEQSEQEYLQELAVLQNLPTLNKQVTELKSNFKANMGARLTRTTIQKAILSDNAKPGVKNPDTHRPRVVSFEKIASKMNRPSVSSASIRPSILIASEKSNLERSAESNRRKSVPMSGLARKQQILQSLINVPDGEIAANRHQTLAFLSSMKTEISTEVKNKEKQRQGLGDKEFSLFNKFYEQLVKEQDAKVNKFELSPDAKEGGVVVVNNPNLRFRAMYLQIHAFNKQQILSASIGCEHYLDHFGEEVYALNEDEKDELFKRAENEAWVISDDLILELLKKELKEKNIAPDNHFLELLLSLEHQKINEVTVKGTEKLISLAKISDCATELENQNVKLKDDFERQANEWQESTVLIEKHIRQLRIKQQDLKFLRGDDLKLDNDDLKIGQDAQLIKNLKRTNTEKKLSVEDVCNFLRNDLYEKERLAQIMFYQSRVNARRFTFRHMQFIQKLFVEQQGRERQMDRIDQILKHLRFLKRLNVATRMLVYENSEFVQIPEKTTIFSEGDRGDKMYIILKGKVKITQKMKPYPDITQYLGMRTDGEIFGELAIVHVSEKLKTREELFAENKRRATCASVEFTEMLVLPSDVAANILHNNSASDSKNEVVSQVAQIVSEIKHLAEKKHLTPNQKEEKQSDPNLLAIPGQPGKDALTSIMSTTVNENSESEEEHPSILDKGDDTDLEKRIQFMQTYSFFKDFSKEDLKAVAVNMHSVNFKYGDYLQREGERPKGMYLIKSGQCKAALRRVATRKAQQAVPGGKKPIKDKHPLFNEFDPENSLLNEIKSSSKAYQNSRIYVREKEVEKEGYISNVVNQIKDQIAYEDLMVFSQIMPRSCFGGRVLPPIELYTNLMEIYFGKQAIERPRGLPHKDRERESDEDYLMKSFLNVIADSGVVETYLITKNEMQYFSDNDLKIIHEHLVQLHDPDRPMPEERILERKKQMIRAEEAKLKMVKVIIMENQIQKHGVMAAKIEH